MHYTLLHSHFCQISNSSWMDNVIDRPWNSLATSLIDHFNFGRLHARSQYARKTPSNSLTTILYLRSRHGHRITQLSAKSASAVVDTGGGGGSRGWKHPPSERIMNIIIQWVVTRVALTTMVLMSYYNEAFEIGITVCPRDQKVGNTMYHKKSSRTLL